MGKSKKTIKELVALDVEFRNEIQIFKEWSIEEKIQFITPIINTGDTGELTIIISHGQIADGRQILLTLKQYLNDEISSNVIGDFIPYGQLSMEAKSFVDNIEFNYIEVE